MSAMPSNDTRSPKSLRRKTREAHRILRLPDPPAPPSGPKPKAPPVDTSPLCTDRAPLGRGVYRHCTRTGTIRVGDAWYCATHSRTAIYHLRERDHETLVEALGDEISTLEVVATGRDDRCDNGQRNLGPDGLGDRARAALGRIHDTIGGRS